MTPAYASQEYFRTKVLTAGPLETVVMIYEVAINALTAAVEQLRNGDAMARAKSVTKAQEAVTELVAAVDHSSGASYTQTLVELYGYVFNQITMGHTQKSEVAFQNAISILRSLHEGFAEAQRRTLEGDSSEQQAPAAPSPYGTHPDHHESRDWTC